MSKFKDKVALITGAAEGGGAGCSTSLCRSNSILMDIKKTEAHAARLIGAGYQAMAVDGGYTVQ